MSAPDDDIALGGVLPALGQTRLAEKFALTHVGKHLHVHGLGWHYWDGQRWAADEGDAHARRALLKVLKIAYTDAFKDPQAQTALRGCYSDSGQRGALNIAATSEAFSTTVSELDADPYLLNTASGTLNLRTFELQDHDPADRITKVTGAEYDEGADRAEWDAFLAEVLPDADVRSYLQRYMGAALLGAVELELLLFLLGPGRNGKGTFYEAMLAALGEYGHVVQTELLLAQRFARSSEAPSPEKLSLQGRRLVTCSESDEGAPLATAQVKYLTGGDEIKARAPFARSGVTFQPSHSLLFVTNKLPKIMGSTDYALWERLRVVPFDVVIPEEQRDPELKLRFKTDQKLWSAMLLWAVEGLRDYRANGMQTPAAVQVASQAYEASSDATQRFLDEACERGPGLFITRTALWEAAKRFASEERLPLFKRNTLYADLEKRGLVAEKNSSSTFGFHGIGLLDVADAEAELATEIAN